MVVLNAAVAGALEGCCLRWEKRRWETGRAGSGLEERKAQSGVKGSYVVEGQWMVLDKKLTSDSLDGSP